MSKSRISSAVKYAAVFGVLYLVLMWVFKDFKVVNDGLFYIRLMAVNAMFFGSYLLAEHSVKKLYEVSKGEAMFFTGMFAFIFWLFIVCVKTGDIGFDTWQVYDMSKYVFSDFGRMDMLRQHIINTPYEMAFPPLFPTLMAVINAVFNMGVYASVAINYFTYVLISCVIAKMATQKPQYKWVFNIMLFILIVQHYSLNLFYTGSTIPLGQLLLIITVYLMLFGNNLKITAKVALIALLSGLGVMNRFDYLPIAVIMGLSALIMGEKLSIKNVLIYGVIFIFVISPWVIYSEIRFDKFFITDNGRRLFNVEDTRPSTFFSESKPAITIFDDFKAWFIASGKRWAIAFLTGLIEYIIEGTMSVQFILAILLYEIYSMDNRGKLIKRVNIKECIYFIKKYKGYFILSLAIAAQACAIIATGYNGNERYYINFGVLLFSIVLIMFYDKMRDNRLQIIIGCIVITTLCVSSWKWITYHSLQTIVGQSTVEENLVIKEGKNAYDYLKKENDPKIILARSGCPVNNARFAELSEMITTLTPSNLSKYNAEDFIEFCGFNFLYSANDEINSIFADTVGLEETGVEGLYRICDK